MTVEIKPGSVWQHHSGSLYTVLFIANDVPDPKPDYPGMVVYQGENGKRWAGRLDGWHRRMTLKSEASEPSGDTVPVPQNADQAALMVLLGTDWLNQHAPERLKPEPSGDVAKMREAATAAAFHAIGGDEADPHLHPEAWDHAEAVAMAVLSTLPQEQRQEAAIEIESAPGYHRRAPQRFGQEEGWQPIESAPKDGSYILAIVAENESRHMGHLAGRMFVIRHEGRTVSDYDMGWAVFPGYGGAPDSFFTHWMPLPSTPKAAGEEG